jgi:hypothetical protein
MSCFLSPFVNGGSKHARLLCSGHVWLVIWHALRPLLAPRDHCASGTPELGCYRSQHLQLLLKPSITRFELAETWFESGPLASMHHACTCFGLGFFYNDELSKIQSMDHFLGVFSLSRKSCPVDFRRIFDNVDALCKITTETLA